MRFVLAVAVAVIISASSGAAKAELGDDLTVSVLTFGPGSHPFLKFGHNAILVERAEDAGLVFNFGTFQFDSPALIPKFLRGRTKYWLSVSSRDATLAAYIEENRTIEAQELDLTPTQKWELWRKLVVNARPENREYLYDYFFDNCSTRVRDAVDQVVGGRVRQAGAPPATLSMRANALRMTADLLPEYLGLHLGLGSPTDQPINLWEEAFLPERMRDLLRRVTIPGPTGDHPLVKSERVLFAARRPPPASRAPSWTLYFLAAGLATALLLAGLGRLGTRNRAARIALGSLVSVIGLVAGLLGLCLVGLWAFTNHRSTHANANITLLAPWAIILVGRGIGIARGRARSMQRAFWAVLLAAGLAMVGVLGKVLPGTAQDNVAWIALWLPIWLGMAAGLRFLMKTVAASAVGADAQKRVHSP